MVSYFNIGISGASAEVVTDITFKVISAIAHSYFLFLISLIRLLTSVMALSASCLLSLASISFFA